MSEIRDAYDSKDMLRMLKAYKEIERQLTLAKDELGALRADPATTEQTMRQSHQRIQSLNREFAEAKQILARASKE